MPDSTEIGPQDDNDYPDDREEYLYQVDGTMDIHTPTDHSADDEDTEPDNNTHRKQRKIYAPADTNRKELKKQRQAQILKNQQENERLKAQALEKQIRQLEINQRGLHHSLKTIAKTLRILTAQDHRSLRVKHITLIKLKVQKREKGNPEQGRMLWCQTILHWIQTPKMKIF